MRQVVEQACSVTNLLIGENLVGVSKDMDLTCHRWEAPGHLGRSPFFPQGTSLFQLQDAPWCLCWHSSLQLPRHDPSMDVPNGPHLWQHLHNEGLKLERAALVLEILTIVSQARETPQHAWPLLSCSRRQVGTMRHNRTGHDYQFGSVSKAAPTEW